MYIYVYIYIERDTYVLMNVCTASFVLGVSRRAKDHALLHLSPDLCGQARGNLF